MLDELHRYTNNLMQDQFGVSRDRASPQIMADVLFRQNYVVQFVLEKGEPEDRKQIISKLRGQMLQMARHKFASNVCEKALMTADPESRSLLIEEIMTPKPDGVSPVVTMMKDQFASECFIMTVTCGIVESFC